VREGALGVSWRPPLLREHARVLRTSAAGEGGPKPLRLMQPHHAPFLQEAAVEAEALLAVARLTHGMTLQSRE